MRTFSATSPNWANTKLRTLVGLMRTPRLGTRQARDHVANPRRADENPRSTRTWRPGRYRVANPRRADENPAEVLQACPAHDMLRTLVGLMRTLAPDYR